MQKRALGFQQQLQKENPVYSYTGSNIPQMLNVVLIIQLSLCDGKPSSDLQTWTTWHRKTKESTGEHQEEEMTEPWFYGPMHSSITGQKISPPLGMKTLEWNVEMWSVRWSLSWEVAKHIHVIQLS